MKQLLRSKSNRIRYQPKALPTRPLSRSRKMKLKGQIVRRNLENQIYRSAEEEQIDRCHPQKNKKTWAMLSFDKNINVKTDERVLGPYREMSFWQQHVMCSCMFHIYVLVYYIMIDSSNFIKKILKLVI